MKLILSVFSFAALMATAAMAQPQISPNGILNAASNAYVGLPNSSIAQGSIFTIYGLNLGPASSPVPSFPLQATLGGVSIQVVSGSTTVNAIPIFVSPKQINAVLPSNTPIGPATLTVTYNGQTNTTASFQVAASSFGIFTFGVGYGIVTDVNSNLFKVNSPAHPGDVATIWGTGLGASPGDDGSGPPAQIDMPNLPLSVYVGAQKADVLYRGRSVFTGEDQINFVVPSGITGCYVPVAVQIGNIVSNFVTMPIAPNGQLYPDPLMGFISLQPLAIGKITFTRGTTIPRTSSAVGSTTITSDTASAFRVPFPDSQLPIASGTCIAMPLRGMAVFLTLLDAGSVLTVTGPHGPKQLTKESNYFAQLGGGSEPLYLDAGVYNVSGPGGLDVGTFSQSFTIPQPLTWTNQGDIATIDRSASLDVTWTGGDPNGTVQIAGISSSDAIGASFTCVAHISDRHFTIPAFVLLSLPPTGSSGSLSLRTVSTTSFAARGLDSGTISSNVTVDKNVSYR